MQRIFILFLILTLATVACQSAGSDVPAAPTPVPVSEATSTPMAAATESFTATPTSLPGGVIYVDTLEQEVYPFVENGKCSLGEAIFSANSGEVKDTCAAGIPDETIIELMPGVYRFTKADKTPPQGDWIYSTVEVGNALPMVMRALTIRGNGATLERDEAAEPFRFFEVMFGTFTLENVTLQNGDVLEDWGGGIYSFNASMSLDRVRFVNNRASNGGGFYFTFGRLTVRDSEFIENYASFGGGGAYFDSTKSTFTNTKFIGNTTDAIGGGIYADSSTLVIEDSIFLKNVNTGNRGGALHLEHVNVTITRSQFYQNQADFVGGAIYINNPVMNGTSDDEGNPLDDVAQLPTILQLSTTIPGFEATLEAHPSGVFQDFYEDIQFHDSCFANNLIGDSNELNYTGALAGRSINAEGNYWGHPSGPSGAGTGRGDGVGRGIVFAPFLTEMPEHCDPSLAQQK